MDTGTQPGLRGVPRHGGQREETAERKSRKTWSLCPRFHATGTCSQGWGPTCHPWGSVTLGQPAGSAEPRDLVPVRAPSARVSSGPVTASERYFRASASSSSNAGGKHGPSAPWRGSRELPRPLPNTGRALEVTWSAHSLWGRLVPPNVPITRPGYFQAQVLPPLGRLSRPCSRARAGWGRPPWSQTARVPPSLAGLHLLFLAAPGTQQQTQPCPCSQGHLAGAQRSGQVSEEPSCPVFVALLLLGRLSLTAQLAHAPHTLPCSDGFLLCNNRFPRTD